MRTRLLIVMALVLAMFAVGAARSGVSVAAADTCSNSFPADGHFGPWYTAPMTLHGNTLKISCPTQNTAWSVDYQVCKDSVITCNFTPINETRSGHGDTQFSISTNPVGCNPGWDYWTHVHNIITGGDISKPPSHGNVIC